MSRLHKIDLLIIYEALTEQKEHLVQMFGLGWTEALIENVKSWIIGAKVNEIPEFEKIAAKFKGDL